MLRQTPALSLGSCPQRPASRTRHHNNLRQPRPLHRLVYRIAQIPILDRSVPRHIPYRMLHCVFCWMVRSIARITVESVPPPLLFSARASIPPINSATTTLPNKNANRRSNPAKRVCGAAAPWRNASAVAPRALPATRQDPRHLRPVAGRVRMNRLALPTCHLAWGLSLGEVLPLVPTSFTPLSIPRRRVLLPARPRRCQEKQCRQPLPFSNSLTRKTKRQRIRTNQARKLAWRRPVPSPSNRLTDAPTNVRVWVSNHFDPISWTQLVRLRRVLLAYPLH
jgi:hypothetical protein